MTCDYCGARAQNATLCPDCTTELGSLLLELIAGTPHDGHTSPGLLDDLEDAATGRARFTEPTHGNRFDAPPKLNPAASRLASAIRAQLACIAAQLPVSDTIWRPPTNYLPPDFIGPLKPNQRRLPPCTYRPKTIELAIWLAGHTAVIARQPDAGQTRRDVGHIVRRIKAVIDCPTPSQPAGTCDCGTALRAPAEAAAITCPHCGIITSTEELHRRTVADAVGNGDAFTAADFPVALAMLGVPYSARSFRRHRAAGTLPIAGYTAEGEPLYRPADLPKVTTRLEQRATQAPLC